MRGTIWGFGKCFIIWPTDGSTSVALIVGPRILCVSTGMKCIKRSIARPTTTQRAEGNWRHLSFTIHYVQNGLTCLWASMLTSVRSCSEYWKLSCLCWLAVWLLDSASSFMAATIAPRWVTRCRWTNHTIKLLHRILFYFRPFYAKTNGKTTVLVF